LFKSLGNRLLQDIIRVSQGFIAAFDDNRDEVTVLIRTFNFPFSFCLALLFLGRPVGGFSIMVIDRLLGHNFNPVGIVWLNL
jgi:hypothetical protein